MNAEKTNFELFLDVNDLHFLYFGLPVQSDKNSTLAALEILEICCFPDTPQWYNIPFQWHLDQLAQHFSSQSQSLRSISVYIYNLSDFFSFFNMVTHTKRCQFSTNYFDQKKVKYVRFCKISCKYIVDFLSLVIFWPKCGVAMLSMTKKVSLIFRMLVNTFSKFKIQLVINKIIYLFPLLWSVYSLWILQISIKLPCNLEILTHDNKI